jgi:RHS repeat-associated protein
VKFLFGLMQGVGMSGWGFQVRVRRFVAALAATGVVAGGLAAVVPAAPAVAAVRPGRAPAVPRVPASRHVGILTPRRPRLRNQAASRARPVGTAWPAAVSGAVVLSSPAPLAAGAPLPLGSVLSGSGGGLVVVPGTPVWGERMAGSSAGGLSVRVLGHAAAVAAGVKGVVFAVRARGPGGRVRVGLDYGGFGGMYGGNFGVGLGLSVLPGCALTTPRVRACQREVRLASVNDAASRSVSAVVGLGAAAGVNRAAAGVAGGAGSGGAVVLAATSSPSGGGAGSYTATSLKPSGSWAAGGSSGSFTYSYPMGVPAAAGGLEPSVGLGYDSGSVDGQTAAAQAQASWAGDGWSTGDAFIEQSFVPCADDPEGSAAPSATQDNCYDGPVLTLSLNGATTTLVCPSSSFSYTTTSTCTPSADDGAVVTHVVGASNGAGTRFGDYWKVAERDGTTYYFGLNELPGWKSGDAATDSVDTEPVFSAHAGDPCFSSAGFSSSSCKMAYRWHLDYVTDVHNNAMAYYYTQATNAYAQDGNTSSAVSYVRDSYLSHIDYGFTAGNAYAGNVPDKVVFTTGDRCFTGTCDPLSSSTAANWLDVPYADNCAAGGSCEVTSPTFWSTVALSSVAAEQWNGSAYVTVDSWALGHEFLATGDGSSPGLWLSSVRRTGSDTAGGGSAVSLPSVSFQGVDLPNRVNPGNYVALDRYRISQVTTETGEQIQVSYELANPCSPSSPPSPSGNASSCFPVYWQQFTPPAAPDWFNKYAVASVDETDPTGGSPGVYTSYAYSGPAWHFDDNEVVEAKFRTYGQFRGYADVKTYTGTGSDAQTESETKYYQGMSDDNNSTAVTLTDSQGGKHDDTDQLAGLPLEATQYNYQGGPVDDSQIYSYWVSAAAATRARSGLPALTANVVAQAEVWSRQAITDTSPASWRDTETDTTYDAAPSDADFGLPLYAYDHGDLSQPSQATCTSTTYAAANASENLAGLPAEVETDAVPCGGTSPSGSSAPGSGQLNALTAPSGVSRPGQVISDRRTFYDDPPVVSGGTVVPSTAAWPQAAPGTADPSVVQQASGYSGGAFTYQTVSATAYDSAGRPVATYDASGNKTTTSYAMTAGSMTGTTVTNALGQATTTTMDPERALPLTTTDPNGIVTTQHYDGLGRRTAVWEDSRATTSPANILYSYAVSATAPTVVTTQVLNDSQGYVTSTALYDALLRPRQTQAPSPAGGVVVSDDFYDSRGWLVKTNNGWWDSSASGPGNSILTVPDSQVPSQTVTAYDGLYRAVLVTSYDDSSVRAQAATAYYGDKTVTVPPRGGAPSATVTDALGRATEIDQYTTAPTVTTSTTGGITSVSVTGGTTRATTYSYNTRGEQSGITSGGQNWTTTYNLLGQVTSTADPDTGTSTNSYDNDGNLASATDAAGNTVSYTYDALGRKTGEYNGPNTSSPPIATLTYDNSNNAISGMTDAVGQLTTATSYDSAGNAYTLQAKGFNAFGEPTGQTWTIPAAQGALAGTYAQNFTYTAVTGLPSTTSYPATGNLPAETIRDGYTPGFDLPSTVGTNQAAGYDQGTSYNAFSQLAQTELGDSNGNDAFITNAYDPNTGLLTDTQVQNTTAQPSAPYDDTSYAYDPSGNITSQTDTQDGAAGTQAETQCYDYNTLGQLTQAWTATDHCSADPSANGGSTIGDGIPGAAYWTSWAFNPLGERTSQGQHSVTGGTDTTTGYTYGTSQPGTLASTSTSTSSPSGTSTTSYAYDADGNTTTRNLPGGNQHLTWNPTGTLAAVTTPAGMTSYVYDAGGNLLLQHDPAQSTLYIFGEQITASGAAVTGARFIGLPGGARVVRTGAGGSYQFELADQQGTSDLTLSATATSPQWRLTDPYGNPRGNPPASWPDTNGLMGDPTDASTGLTTIGARSYDPSTGMFISADPLLEPGSPADLNGYTYAADNPITNTDPTGETTCSPDGSCSTGSYTGPTNQVHVNGGKPGGSMPIISGGSLSTTFAGIPSVSKIISKLKPYIRQLAVGFNGQIPNYLKWQTLVSYCSTDTTCPAWLLRYAAFQAGTDQDAYQNARAAAQRAAGPYQPPAWQVILGGALFFGGEIIGDAIGGVVGAAVGDVLGKAAGAVGDALGGAAGATGDALRTAARFVTGPDGITADTTTTRFVADSSGTITDRLAGRTPNAVSLGRYPTYLNYASITGARTFNVGDAWEEMAARAGRFGGTGDGSEIWIRNTRFLDQAVTSGSDIVTTANPADPANEGSFFLRELEHLYGAGG